MPVSQSVGPVPPLPPKDREANPSAYLFKIRLEILHAPNEIEFLRQVKDLRLPVVIPPRGGKTHKIGKA